MQNFILLLLLLTLAQPVHADDPGKVPVGDFSAGKLDGWGKKVFSGETSYGLVFLGNETVLKADSQDSASGLIKKITVDLHKYPYLNWRWRIENRLDKADEKTKPGDDYTARIYVIDSGGLFFWATKVLGYVWSDNSQKGATWPNPYVINNVQMFAIRSAADDTSTWYSEKHNVYEDFKRLFGKDVHYIDAVVLMTDSDNSNGHAEAFYGDIYFSME